MFWSGTLVLLFVLSPLVMGSEAEQKLVDKIFEHYNPVIRPVKMDNESVNVTLNMRFYQLISIREKEQVLEVAIWIHQKWKDNLLQWNPDNYNGISEINVRSDQVWTPDIVLYNYVNDDNAEFGGNLDTLGTRVVIQNTGTLLWMSPLIIKARCEISVRDFPYDTQNCFLKFGSWTYDQARLDIRSTHTDTSRYQTNLEWQLENVESIRTAEEFDGLYYPTVTFHFSFHRRSLFYILNLIFPIAIITLLTIATFILPDESGERLSVSVTLMLATTVFMLLVAEKIPESSESVPLVGKFFIFCMVEMFFIIIAICCISRFYHRTASDRPMGQWTRKYIFDKLSFVVGTRRKIQILTSTDNSKHNNVVITKKDNRNSYHVALMNGSNEWKGEKVSKAKQEADDEQIEYTKEDEWYIVATTVDRCLLIFFTLVFAVACMVCFIGTKYVA